MTLDLLFPALGESVPTDHRYALYAAVSAAVPDYHAAGGPRFPGVVEITDAAGASRLVPFTTDASGHILVDAPAAPGRYDVQIFSNSTDQAAEAESQVRQVVVPA